MNKENEKKIQKYYEIIKDEQVSEEDIRKALKLDRELYQISDDEQFNIEKCLNWNKRNGYKIYTMIKDPKTDDVVGYINAVPINDKCYEEIKSGKYPDVDINDNDVVAYEHTNIPKKYNLYFASIVIDTKKDKLKRFSELYNAFLDKLINLTNSNIIIYRMIADAISKEGKSLCETIGMEKKKDTDHDDSAVYELELYPPKFPVRSPKQKELYDVLIKKYQELEGNAMNEIDNLNNNFFFKTIDMDYVKDDGINYYRVMDGIPSEISAKLYDDLIINNFAEKEREAKKDFQAFYEKNRELDAHRENLNVVAVSNGKFVGLLTGMAFHKSKLGYFDYIVVDESARSKGIGGGLIQAGKSLMKSVAQQHGYDHENLAVLLTVEKATSTMNLDKEQDPSKRLSFYTRQNFLRVAGMPCYVPGIVDSENDKAKEPIDCYDWLITGVNRNFQNGEIIMNRKTALRFNIDNIDLQYTDPLGRPAKKTETYKKIKKGLSKKIYAESLKL